MTTRIGYIHIKIEGTEAFINSCRYSLTIQGKGLLTKSKPKSSLSSSGQLKQQYTIPFYYNDKVAKFDELLINIRVTNNLLGASLLANTNLKASKQKSYNNIIANEVKLKTVIESTVDNINHERLIALNKGFIILGVHSNTSPKAGFLDGHAWISYRSSNGTNITTYGLWPDTHEDVPDNGSGTDVRIGMEVNDIAAYNRYYKLTPNQLQRWKKYSSKTAEWKYTRTCASWASDAIQYVVNEDVDADDISGFETPRELSIHIIKLEQENKTSPSSPYISKQNNSRSF